MNRQTYHAKNDEVTRRWLHVDATDQVMGRLATRLAVILMGKHKPEYTPHHDVGDFVVVTNASQLKLTGRKAEQRLYDTYSGYPGGRRTYSYQQMLEHAPDKLLRRAVWRMMPRTRLARQQIKKLKIYAGAEHPHTAQQPEQLQIQSA